MSLQAADGVMPIGHRGFLGKAPENTIASFAAAQAAGAAYVDVRATQDGVLVLMHDATVDRTTTGKGRVGRRAVPGGFALGEAERHAH